MKTYRMACSMTVEAVEQRIKTVTRRDPATWKYLKRGDELVLVRKLMGLKKGQKQEVIARAVVVDVTVEQLGAITPRDIVREGLGDMPVDEFIRWWADEHGHKKDDRPDLLPCRRIEWRYLE